MRVTNSLSARSPRSARSLTTRRRLKLTFAPEDMQTQRYRMPFSSASSARLASQSLHPASATAPAGSRMLRVSSNASRIAAQTRFVGTVTMPSTVWRATRSVSSPGVRTATPSQKPSTVLSTTRLSSLRARLCIIAFAPDGSTPTTRTSGRSALTYVAMPAMSPPPPTGTKMTSCVVSADFVFPFALPSCVRISSPTVPWPAMTCGSSNGCT
mmetsp:Transcript_6572/g.17083  ORF Transcript_6572/g.17083 Transcript_6572/m.17083 type:complete len:212 (+) Transcript_6572:618-1253(+)